MSSASCVAVPLPDIIVEKCFILEGITLLDHVNGRYKYDRKKIYSRLSGPSDTRRSNEQDCYTNLQLDLRRPLGLLLL